MKFERIDYTNIVNVFAFKRLLVIVMFLMSFAFNGRFHSTLSITVIVQLSHACSFRVYFCFIHVGGKMATSEDFWQIIESEFLQNIPNFIKNAIK